MVEPARLPEVAFLPARRSPVHAAFVALRPRQWLKNLLLFAGIIFAKLPLLTVLVGLVPLSIAVAGVMSLRAE